MLLGSQDFLSCRKNLSDSTVNKHVDFAEEIGIDRYFQPLYLGHNFFIVLLLINIQAVSQEEYRALLMALEIYEQGECPRAAMQFCRSWGCTWRNAMV
ncbi:MAG: hypothetical protein O8C64_05450 [Candidatus Methanoperedens sp.]|nr:hypothetical protein [Candidatus Methanoperedens sp.]